MVKVTKQLTINLQQYESLKIGVEDAPSFQDADQVIKSELDRIGIPVSEKIKQCLCWKNIVNENGNLNS